MSACIPEGRQTTGTWGGCLHSLKADREDVCIARGKTGRMSALPEGRQGGCLHCLRTDRKFSTYPASVIAAGVSANVDKSSLVLFQNAASQPGFRCVFIFIFPSPKTFRLQLLRLIHSATTDASVYSHRCTLCLYEAPG